MTAAVSIIIPVYNVSPFLKRCLQSVQTQTLQNYQLILIDGGSTDDTFEKCYRLMKDDPRVLLIRKKGEALGPSRNIGIALSEADYITFLDADDWWRTDYLQLMLEGTERGRNDIVLCDIHYMRQDGDSITDMVSALRLSPGETSVGPRTNFINNGRTFAWGKLYRRDLLTDLQVLQPAHAYEDVATTPYLLAKVRSAYHVPQPMYYYYRNREGSLSSNPASLNYLTVSLQELNERFKENKLYDEYIDELRRLCWGQLCFLYRQTANPALHMGVDQRESLRKNISGLFASMTPKLAGLEKKTFAVQGSDLLQRAVGHLIPDSKNQLAECDSADYCIYDIAMKAPTCTLGRSIGIDVPQINDKENAETVAWDMADKLFWKLLDK